MCAEALPRMELMGYLHMGPLTGAAWLLLSVHVVWTNGLQEDNISTGKLPARHTTWKNTYNSIVEGRNHGNIQEWKK